MGEARGRRGRAITEAFDRFCVAEYPRLLGAVTFVVGDRDIATDAVNEALARAWNRARRGHEVESLAAWIRVVAINIAYNEFRRRSTEARHLPKLVRLASGSVDPESAGVAHDVQAAVASLPRRQREVAVWRFMFDMPIDEIASELRISRGTVKSTLQKARASLGNALRPREEEVFAHDVA
jgi:RNA polymerase sigma-70 factor (ECF subfamily)